MLASTYYGVYSNAAVSAQDSVTVNFVQVPSAMVVKDGSTLESASYYSQVAGGKDGDVQVKLLVENISTTDIEDLYVVVKTMNNVLTYTGNYPTERTTTSGNHVIHYTNVSRGEELGLTLNFNVTPKDTGEYRYFEIPSLSPLKLRRLCPLYEKVFFHIPWKVLCPSAKNLMIKHPQE